MLNHRMFDQRETAVELFGDTCDDKFNGRKESTIVFLDTTDQNVS